MVNDINQVRLAELKNQIKKHWGKLTDEDLSRLNDGGDELVYLLRRRYGYGKAQAEIEIKNWLHEVEPSINKYE